MNYIIGIPVIVAMVVAMFWCARAAFTINDNNPLREYYEREKDESSTNQNNICYSGSTRQAS